VLRDCDERLAIDGKEIIGLNGQKIAQPYKMLAARDLTINP